MLGLLPSSPELLARLDAGAFDRRHLRAMPRLALSSVVKDLDTTLSRRGFLAGVGAALSAFGLAPAQANTGGPLVFRPHEARREQSELPARQPARGEIPADFWMRPRELFLRRQGTKDEVRVVYWKDGKLVPDGYWQVCALMRDVRANMMTTMDPVLLDVLRGIFGYYQAWHWPHPLVITSGYRTAQTNKALASEGAAKNSMHLYGKAADLYMPGIPPKDIAALGKYLQQGGVGFYPSKGFTHLDTGKLRYWRG